jgi:hypothetical protein
VFIAVEGADGSGKSSLISSIKAELLERHPRDKILEFHKGRPEEESRQWVLSEYVIGLERLNWSDFIHGVADRWHWGEITYAPLKRPHTDKDGFGLLGIAGWRWVELFMASRGMTQFWLYQPLEVITERLQARGDDFVQAGELARILDLYHRAADATYAVGARLVPASDDMASNDEFAKIAVDIATETARQVEVLTHFPEYIGGPRPSVLLVGDRRNGPTDTILPFKPINGNSGEYLLSSLPETLWRSVGIINAEDLNGARAHKLLSTLGAPHMIALGRNAEYELRNSGFYTTQYTVVPHPQYVRRFHHQDRFEYGRAIERLATTHGKEHDTWILP